MMWTSFGSTMSLVLWSSWSSSAGVLLTVLTNMRPSSVTSFLVVFILSLSDVLLMLWVLVLALLPLFLTLCSVCLSLCSASSTSLSLISGSSVISKGVSPLLVTALISAPFCDNISTASRWPQHAAAWRGCQRSTSWTSVLQWWSSKNSSTER